MKTKPVVQSVQADARAGPQSSGGDRRREVARHDAVPRTGEATSGPRPCSEQRVLLSRSPSHAARARHRRCCTASARRHGPARAADRHLQHVDQGAFATCTSTGSLRPSVAGVQAGRGDRQPASTRSASATGSRWAPRDQLSLPSRDLHRRLDQDGDRRAVVRRARSTVPGCDEERARVSSRWRGSTAALMVYSGTIRAGTRSGSRATSSRRYRWLSASIVAGRHHRRADAYGRCPPRVPGAGACGRM